MDVSELLTRLSQQGIEIWAEGSNLSFRAPKGALTPELRNQLVANKPLILDYLQEQARHTTTYTPLSFGQQSMWIIHQTAPKSTAYHVSFSVRLRSALDTATLRGTFQTIIDRHPLLRTTYTWQNGALVQAVHGTQEVFLETVDAAGMTDADLHQAVLSAYARPFDLENGPLLRVHLFTRAPDDHVLLLVTHHIAVDGWSLWLLLDDFHALYPAQVRGDVISLPRPEAPYVDYVDWQNTLLTSAEGERLWNYWRGKLTGELAPLNLPADHARPTMPSFNGASHFFALDDGLTRRLREWAKAEGVTLYMLLSAAFQTLLYRYAGQETVLLGSPMFGRNRPEFAKIVGHFVNMVTLRADFSDKPTFRQLLKQMRQTILEALDHQDYPFPLLVRRLGEGRDVSRSPIFQVTFDLQRLQQNRAFSDLFTADQTDVQVDFAGLRAQPYLMPQQEGQFDLSVQMAEVGDSLSGTFKYSTDLFTPCTIQRMTTHFVHLLEGILANSDASVAALPLLTTAEREQLLTAWNKTQAEYPQSTLPDLFEAQVVRNPGAVAVIEGKQSLTYAELNRRANQFAHYLQTQAVTTETLVGVSLERSIETTIALLGIHKAGAAYVPLDPHYPQDRLAFMVQDSGLKLLVTHSSLLENLPLGAVKTILIDKDAAAIASQRTTNPARTLTPDNAAYVIYTSGSTGRPKGVVALHRGAVNRFQWMWSAYPFQPNEVNSQKTTLNFVDSIWETFGALLAGVPTVIIPDEVVKDPTKLVATLAENKVTRLVLVPSLLRAILDSIPNLAVQLPALKYWITSGEALPADLLLRFRQSMPAAKLINLYGSSEVAADVTYYDTADYTADLGNVPIGRPIASSQIYILDANLQPVPLGTPGEILVGGAGLARGYHNRPDLTAEKFIPDPFSSNANARLYRTGDLGRYLPDGTIQYTGRVDHQVKLRGYRIELGEVESALRALPDVQQSLVVLREDVPGDPRLVAYWTGSNPITVQELRDALRKTLLDYMIPSSFIRLEAMPLTPNGKVDRRMLPPPEYARPEVSGAVVLPQTATEIRVAEVWRDLLHLEQISAQDNFFDLGGHSLLAVQVVNKLGEETGLKIEPAVMRFQTLGQLAAMYDQQLTTPT